MKKLLILDLDETLFHASKTRLPITHDFTIENYFAYKRPHVGAFIEFCKQRFELAVWTSATSDYAHCVVSEVIGDPEELKFLWHREQCITRMNTFTYEPIYIKDLKKVKRKGIDLNHVIALDDSPEKLKRNYGNLLRIDPFVGDVADDALIRLMPYLETLQMVKNVRTVEKRGWKSTS